jgi:hypothetical protein
MKIGEKAMQRLPATATRRASRRGAGGAGFLSDGARERVTPSMVRPTTVEHQRWFLCPIR